MNIKLKNAHFTWKPYSEEFYVTENEIKLKGAYCNQTPQQIENFKSKRNKQLKMMVELWHRVLIDKMNPVIMHNQLIKIPEYCELLSGGLVEGMVEY